jgi:hypothetical protein
MADRGLPYTPSRVYAKVDPTRAHRLAAAYEAMPHDPGHPLTRAAYEAMARETMEQYHAAKRAGFKAEFWHPERERDPYTPSPRLAVEDINRNHHMYVFPTRSGYGQRGITPEDIAENPLLQDSGERWNGEPVTVNDIFRATHDYFGHAKEGVGFRHDGEENAWRSHAAMYSPLARIAMTNETRGQNSWVNFGPHGEANRTALGDDTEFAPQKIGHLPPWAVHEGAEDFTSPAEIAAIEAAYRQARAGGGRARVLSPEDVLAMSRLPISRAPAAHRPGERNVTLVGNELAARGQAALKRLGVRSGRVDGSTSRPHVDEALAHALALEAGDAMASHGNAASWYKEKVEEAIRVAALSHPEILTNPNARSAWAAALAITSQGEVVHRNADLADWAYQRFKDNGGRFNIDDVAAEKGPAMAANFKKYDALIDRHHNQGLDGVRDYLNQPMKAGDLKSDGWGLPSGMNVDTDTHGSAMFGPKIGGGFYQNLMGNFHPVTQDQWFMRTFGRLAGTLMDTTKTEEGRRQTLDRYTRALQAEGIKVPRGEKALGALAKTHFKQWEKKFRLYRPQYDAGAFRKGELDNAAQRVTEMHEGVQQDPGSGTDRAWREGIVHRARQILKERTGHDLTPADFQATIWYPEKDLWRHMGSTGGPRGAESNNVDYSQAFQRIARQRGHTDDAIQGALGRPLDPDERPVAQAGPDPARDVLGGPGPGPAAHVARRDPGSGPKVSRAVSQAPPPGLAEGYARGGPVYPIAPRDQWYGDANYAQTGGKLTSMSPDQFLGQVRPLEIDEASRDNIDDLKNHIQSGRTLDPLQIAANGKEDGRHRAHAAKELGIKRVPVLTWPRTARAAGGFTPLLTPAVSVGGKRYKGYDHLDALSKVPQEQRQAATLDGSNRGFISDQGRWLRRTGAANYARAYDLVQPRYNDWAKTAQEIPAEWLKSEALGVPRPEEREGRAEGGGFPHAPKPHLFHSNLGHHHLHVGPIHSAVHGRTDHLPMHVPSGSYVIPADVVSAHGEGNTMAGFRVMRRTFGGTPYGQHGGPYGKGGGPYDEPLSRGGRADDGGDEGVPIVAAGGEYVLSPDQVRAVGDGDADLGTKVLDEFVKRSRARNIKTLQKLPGPAKD